MTDRIDFGGRPWHAIPREVLRDSRLSLKARGALVTLLSHEEGWVRSSIATLMRETRCGRDAAKAAMAELREAGYAKLVRERDLEGHLRSHYIILAEPLRSAAPTSGTLGDGKPDRRETRPTGNPAAVVEALDVDPQDVEEPKEQLPMSAIADAEDPNHRTDVEFLCTLLADEIAGNGVKRPAFGERWRTSARLLIDRDGYAPTKIEDVIRWCQADEFWRSNILSMPKLREKFAQLLLRMNGNKGKDRHADPEGPGMRTAKQFGLVS